MCNYQVLLAINKVERYRSASVESIYTYFQELAFFSGVGCLPRWILCVNIYICSYSSRGYTIYISPI